MAQTLEVRTKRKGTVTATVLQVNARSCWVRLPDGNVVKRKVIRDYYGGDVEPDTEVDRG